MTAAANPPCPGIAPERMAALVASRLCHDLVSPLGAIGNGVELIEMGGPAAAQGQSPEMQLIADSVAAARARIRVFRVAFGHTAPDQRMSVGDLRALLRDIAEGSRLQIELDAQGDLPRTEARLILLAAMCLDTSLPWGGRVFVVRAGQGWRLVAEADRTRPAPELWAWLAPRDGAAHPRGHHPSDPQPVEPQPSEPQPSEVHFALLSAHAAVARRSLAGEIDDKGAEISF